MKKILFISITLSLTIIFILGFYLYKYTSFTNTSSKTDGVLVEDILNNSKWLKLTKEDLNGYLNGTITPSIQSIINSLENAIPVIFKITSNKFSNVDGGTFIVASAFNSNNEIYVYYYDSETTKYEKTVSTLEFVLEDATDAFIYNGTEGL